MSGPQLYQDNYKFNCTAYPIAPYQFVKWEAFNYSSTATYTSNPLSEYFFGNMTLTAFFRTSTTYTVTLQSEDTNKGTVSGGGSTLGGGSVLVTASPNSGFTFDGWYLNGSIISTSTSLTYRPSETCTLTAKFNMSIPVFTGDQYVCNSAYYYISIPTQDDWSLSPQGGPFSITSSGPSFAVVSVSPQSAGSFATATLKVTAVNGYQASKPISSCSMLGSTYLCPTTCYYINSGASASWSVSSGFSITENENNDSFIWVTASYFSTLYAITQRG